MRSLFELFTRKNPAATCLQQFSQGCVFTLTHDVALVLDGVIAVETLPDCGSAAPVTVRLAGEEEFLNLELLLLKSAGESQQYVVESDTALVSLLNVSHLRSVLDLGDAPARLALYGAITLSLCRQLVNVTETASWLGACQALDKTGWALRRLRELQPGKPALIPNSRLASHVGVNVVTICRMLKLIDDKEKGIS